MRRIRNTVARLLTIFLAVMEIAGHMPGNVVLASEDGRYPYMIYASSDEGDAVSIQAGNFGANGNIGTRGGFLFEGNNCNINGRVDEHLADGGMPDLEEGIVDAYFSGSTVQEDDVEIEEVNININEAVATEGEISLCGNINLNSGLMAEGDITLDGDVKNSDGCVVYSARGDIVLDSTNLNLNGLMYAPRGEIHITAMNANMNQVVLIARKVRIEAMSVNGGSNNRMAEFIGCGYGVLEDGEGPDKDVSDNTASDNTASGNSTSDNTASDNAASGNTASGNGVSDNATSGNTVSGDSVSGNAASENDVSVDIPEGYGILRYEVTEGMKDIGIAYIKDIVSEDEIGCTYEGFPIVKNQLLLYGTDGITFGQMKHLLDGYGFDIVGYMETIYYYQVESRDELTPQALEDARLELEAEERIMGCDYNYVMEDEPSFSTNDAELKGADWNDREYSRGNNWYMDLIDMRKAMEVAGIIQPGTVSGDEADLSMLNKVKIGIIDNCFDLWNEDLIGNYGLSCNNFYCRQDLVDAVNSETDAEEAQKYHHGTHVAGIVGAEFNNGIGISGICLTPSLYYFALNPNYVDCVVRKKPVIKLHYAMHIMIENDVRVINYSYGYYEEAYAASQGVKFYECRLIRETIMMDLFLHQEDLYYPSADYLIVTAAGNMNNVKMYKYEEKTNFGQVHDAYIKVSEYNKLNSKDSLYNSVKDKNTTYGAKGSGATVTGNCVDARYSNCFSYSILQRDRVIVVGAVTFSHSDQTYTRTGFSNTGQRVDLYAPGSYILSTSITGLGDVSCISPNYIRLEGTSMASPVVAGMAGFVLSVHPELSAAELKQRILEGCITVSNGNSVSQDDVMIKIPNLANSMAGDAVIVWVLDENGKSVSDAEISVLPGTNCWRQREVIEDYDGNSVFTTDEDGKCEIHLEKADYTLRIRSPYYDEKFINIYKTGSRVITASLVKPFSDCALLTIPVIETATGQEHEYFFILVRDSFVQSSDVMMDLFFHSNCYDILSKQYVAEGGVTHHPYWTKDFDSVEWLANAVISEYEGKDIQYQVYYEDFDSDDNCVSHYLPPLK